MSVAVGLAYLERPPLDPRQLQQAHEVGTLFPDAGGGPIPITSQDKGGQGAGQGERWALARLIAS